ncbi:hypothetical protein L484_008597 [Morus notabilis]|uniref:Uncharacterized protein n=1 Tax=Morus notabilis TaxID=981085 RepID=W9QJK2_9ROSA|nr:hypothetical protein L484_008597 [Morus notabilis]
MDKFRSIIKWWVPEEISDLPSTARRANLLRSPFFYKISCRRRLIYVLPCGLMIRGNAQAGVS